MKHLSVLLTSFAFLFFSSKTARKTFHINGYAQGTTYNITYYAADSLILKNDIEQLLTDLDGSLSIYKNNSLISKFNESTSGIIIDEHLKAVVEKSLDISQKTSGLFDITIYPIVNAWGFGTSKIKGFPDSLEIQKLLPCVGYRNIRLNNNFLEKNKTCVKIDVNGIAQGYSVDCIAKLLESKGINNYIVELGGELRIRGAKPDKSKMKIGIEAPATEMNDNLAVKKVISINKGAITTSGNYRKYLELGGKRASHLLNPMTGRPNQNEMISVTVIAKDAMTADGYDNALMAMSVQQALAFIERTKDMEAYLIYVKKDGGIADTASRGFEKYVLNN